MLRSTDGSVTWNSSSRGMSGLFGSQVAVDPASPSTVYLAANGSGIFKSTDGGLTWVNLIRTSALAVAVDPFSSQHLVASASGSSPNGPVIQTQDGGSTWQNVSLPTQFAPLTVVFHPLVKNTIFLCFLTSGGVGVGVLRSTDGGATWAAANTGLTTAASLFVPILVVHPADPNTLYIGTGAGVFKSTDRGNSWVQKSSGIAVSDLTVPSLAINPSQPQIIYAATTLTPNWYKSVDGGESWQQLNVSLTSFVGRPDMVIDPSAPDTLFIDVSSGLVGWSPDGGLTWKSLTNGLGVAFFALNGSNRMVIARTNPEVLYIPSPNNSILSLVIGP